MLFGLAPFWLLSLAFSLLGSLLLCSFLSTAFCLHLLLVVLCPFLHTGLQIACYALFTEFRHKTQGVGSDGVVTSGIGLIEIDLHLKGVEVIDEGIPDPIVDGIVVLAGIDDKSIVAVEVQARETWQGVATCRKIEHEMFQDGTFAFEQVAVLQGRLEGCQDDVIGKIMGVGDIDDRIVVDAVVPYGVGTDVGTAGGAEDAL